MLATILKWKYGKPHAKDLKLFTQRCASSTFQILRRKWVCFNLTTIYLAYDADKKIIALSSMKFYLNWYRNYKKSNLELLNLLHKKHKCMSDSHLARYNRPYTTTTCKSLQTAKMYTK